MVSIGRHAYASNVLQRGEKPGIIGATYENRLFGLFWCISWRRCNCISNNLGGISLEISVGKISQRVDGQDY